MITHGLDILPLIRFIKMLVLAPHQPWYADDAAIMVLLALIVEYFNALTLHRLRFGFYLEPKRSIVVAKEGYEEAAAQFFAGLWFKIVTGTRYLGGTSAQRSKNWID